MSRDVEFDDKSTELAAPLLKSLVKYYVSSRRGLLSQWPTHSSVRTFWYHFVAGYRSGSGIAIRADIAEDVGTFEASHPEGH